MESLISKLFDALATETGIVSLVLFTTTIFTGSLYTVERSDRREAWKSLNELKKETNDVISGMTVVLEIIKERLGDRSH